MKKRISILLAVVMVITLTVLAIPFSTFADEIVYETDPEAVVAKVYTGSGSSRVHYADIKLANVVSELDDDSANANTTNVISKAARSNGGSAVEVDILANINLGANRIGFSANSKGTVINGGGYTIEGEFTGGNRVTSARALEAGSVLTVKSLNIYCDTGSSGMQTYSNLTINLEGCTITSTAHYGIYHNNDAILNVDKNTVISGGQYGINVNGTATQKAVININGGTVKKIGSTSPYGGLSVTSASSNNVININEGSMIVAEGTGNAILLSSTGSPTINITGATIKTVEGSGAGNAIYVDRGTPKLTINSSTIHTDAGMAVLLAQAKDGSGNPYTSAAEVTINGTSITGSTTGSGLLKTDGSTAAHYLEVNNSTIAFDKTDNAITFIPSGCEYRFVNTKISTKGGGATFRLDAGEATIIGGTITAPNRSGGAIEAKGGSTVTVEGTVISGGTGAGIGLQGNGTTVTASGVTVLTTGSGMPLKIVAGAKNCTLIIKDGYFEGVNGNGVIYVDGATTSDAKMTQNVNITIYDGYFRALGTARVLNAAGNAGVQGDITIYGGTYVATNTGGAVRPNDGGALAVKMYGGHVYNYQTDADRQPAGNGSQIVAAYVSGKYTAADGTTQVTSGVWNVAEIFAETVKVAEGDNKISLNAIDRSLWYTNSNVTNTTLYYQKNSARLPLAPQAEKGAEVRIATGSDGIRFVSTIPTALEARLASTVKGIDADSISYGTAIVPTHYITDNRLNTFSPVALETLGVTVLKIPATEKGTTVDEENGIITIRAAVIGMNETQKLLAYSAVPYVTYTVNGESVYLYGIYDYVNNSRTIPNVAERAICDVVSEEDRGLVNEDGDVYSNPVEIEGVTYYSIYSTSAYEKLKYYAALDGTADDYEGLAAAVAGNDDAANVASILG